MNLVGVFVVSPTVTGYTPTPSEIRMARSVLVADDDRQDRIELAVNSAEATASHMRSPRQGLCHSRNATWGST